MKTEKRQLCREFAANYARELRESNKERLKWNLDELESYCRPVGTTLEDEFQRNVLLTWTLRDVSGSGSYVLDKLGFWPSRELLREIECDVLVLAGQHERVKLIFPIWKAFEQVDKRVKGLRLKSRVNDLIRHAQRLLSDESALAKAVTEAKAGNAQAQRSLRDPQKLGELLSDDREMVIQWCLSLPLVLWTILIGHPMAEHFAPLAECFDTAEEIKADELRAKNRGRVERWRLRHKKSR